YGASASANSKYDFATTAQQDSSGAWGETGTGRRTRSGGTHDSYSGSGTYSESGDGWGTWSGTGTVAESGADDATYGYTTTHAVSGSAAGAGWAWASGSGGTGGAQGSGFANWGVSSSGAYAYDASDVGDGEGTVS